MIAFEEDKRCHDQGTCSRAAGIATKRTSRPDRAPLRAPVVDAAKGNHGTRLQGISLLQKRWARVHHERPRRRLLDYRFAPAVLDYLSNLEPEDRAYILKCVFEICRSPQVDNRATSEMESGGFRQRIRDFGDYFVLFDVVIVDGQKFVAIYEIGR